MTETSFLQGIAAYDENKTDISNHPNNATSFKLLHWSEILWIHYNFRMKRWELVAKVTGKVNGEGHIWNKQTHLFTLLLFVWIRRTHFKISVCWCLLIWPSTISCQDICRHSDDITNLLTHWGRDEMADIFKTILSNAFYWMKIYQFWLIFHLSLFPRVKLTMIQHWFR